MHNRNFISRCATVVVVERNKTTLHLTAKLMAHFLKKQTARTVESNLPKRFSSQNF